MPISRVRSVQVASTTFMMTTPPMTRKDGDDADHGGGDYAGELLPKIHESGGIENAEGVGFIGAKMTARAHEDASFVLGFLHPFGATSLDVDGEALIGAINFDVRLDGDVSEIVLGLAEDGAKWFGDTDDSEKAAVNPDIAADGVNVREKLFGKIVADHRDHGAVLVVAIGDIAALVGFLDINLTDVGGDAADVGVFDALRADADFGGGAVDMIRSESESSVRRSTLRLNSASR